MGGLKSDKVASAVWHQRTSEYRIRLRTNNTFLLLEAEHK